MKLNNHASLLLICLTMMQRSFAFVSRQVSRTTSRSVSSSLLRLAEEGQAEVVLVGCGAPNRGMGWYHAIQMLEKK
jgi:hypothetical protein